MQRFLKWFRRGSRAHCTSTCCPQSKRLSVEQLEDRLVLSVTRGSISLALTHSTEFYQNFINNGYQQYLGRGPDAGGLNFWTDQMLNHGLTDEQFAAHFIGSPEYIANHGGAGSGWVKGMYNDLLGRLPDDAGLQYWLSQLNSGAVTPQQVAYGFAASPEREGIVVQKDYGTFLGRSAAPAEVNFWVNSFVQGAANENVVAGFVGATEYYQNHLNSPSAWLTAAFKDILNRAPDSAGYDYWYMQLTGQQPTQTTYNGVPNPDQQAVLAAANAANSLTDVSMLTAATDGAGHVREFALDADYRLWVRSGSTWTPESNNVYSISTVTNAQGNVELFAVDGNGTAWFRVAYESGDLSNWYQLFPDTVAVAALSAVTDANGSIEFFVTDTTNHLFLRTVDQYNNWSGWNSLNGLVSSVSAVEDANGFVELFAVGSNTHHVFQRVEDAGSNWGNWLDLTQYLTNTYGYTPVTAYSIAAVNNSLGGVELFAAGQSGTGQNQNIFQALEDSSGNWGTWWDLGINNKAAAIAATQDGNSLVNLFAVGAVSHNAFVNTETGYAHDPQTGAIYGTWSGWNQQTTGVANSTITDYTTLAQQVGTGHKGTTILYLNFDGGDISYQDVNGQTITQHMAAFTGSSQDIQTIINDVAAIYAPFNVQVQQIHGFGNYDSSSNGNTTIFVGADSNDVASDGRKYNTSFTPFIFCDCPGAYKGYNHVPNSDPYDLAFADPVYQQQAGGQFFIESDAQIADGIAHEAGHTFGLMHVLTGDGSGTYNAQNPPDIMSYDSPNQQFLNHAYPLTDLNYEPTKGGNVHGGDHFYPQWNNNGTIETMATQNSYTYLLTVLGAHP
jgi:hypothetical protein